MLHDALVEALEAGREERQPLFRSELLDGLIELPPLRRQRHHAVLGDAAVDGVERCRDHVDAEHHARTAAVRLLVYLAALERREVGS